jgi:2',3'-cyclic-nucleotide 2'-phosphodiesterase (5'-nucleotidase family)
LEVPTVVADAGGFIRDSPTDPDMGRTRILLKALHDMGLKYANVGYTDIGGGVDKVKNMAQEAGVELISANVSDASGKLLFQPYAVQTVKTKNGEMKVGFIGVTRPRIPVPKRKVTSGTAEAATPTPAPAANDKSGGATVGDMQEALQKYVPELRQKSDIVVALIFDRRDKISEFLKDLPAEGKVDVAISGEYLQPQANVLDINGTKLVSAGYEGRQSGLLTFSAKDKKISATSNELIEILQSIPTVPEITKYVNDAKNLTLQPTAVTPTHINAAEAAKLNLSKNGGTTAIMNAVQEKQKQKEAEKGASPAKLDLGNP